MLKTENPEDTSLTDTRKDRKLPGPGDRGEKRQTIFANRAARAHVIVDGKVVFLPIDKSTGKPNLDSLAERYRMQQRKAEKPSERPAERPTEKPADRSA